MPAYTLVAHLYAKPENVDKVKAKMQEASQTYSKDKETLNWFIMQDHKDPQAFCIVERYKYESSQQYHLGNPYWKTFDPYIIPLLEKDIELHRYNEIDSEQEVKVDKNPELWEAVEKHQAK